MSAAPPLIGTKHPNDPKYQKYKKFYKNSHHHHENDGYCNNGWIWLFWFLMVGGFIAVIIVVPLTYPHQHHPTYVVTSRQEIQNPIIRRETPPRSACKTGERFDDDLNRCAPQMHVPLAFDGSLMDHQKAPCDSFYRAMCGRWNDEHMNDNRAFSYGYAKNEARIAKLVDFETEFRNGVIRPSPSTSSITDFYRSCISASISHVNKKSAVLQHKHMLRKILGNAKTVADMPKVIGRLARYGYTAPFSLSIERHPTQPRMIPLLTWDGFPRELDESHIILTYRNTRNIHNLGMLEMDEHVDSVAAIIRACRLHNQRPLSSITDYQQYVEEEFHRDVYQFQNLPQDWNVRGHHTMRGWDVFFEALDGTGLRFEHDQDVWMIDKPYFDWLIDFGLGHFTFKDWYAFVEFSVLWNGHDFVPDLPSDVYFQQHELKGPIGPGGRLYNRLPRLMNSTHSQTNVEHKCVKITQHLLPGLVAKEFLKKHFPQKDEIKHEVREMVQHIIDAFIDQVQATPWMTTVDKQKLIEKMQNTIIRVAEPDQWDAEPFAESISPDTYWRNLNMIRRYRVQRNLELWSRDLPNSFDRSAVAFFAIPLTSVNAYFSGPTNTVTVLAGILQHPFYTTQYNGISKYAILGSILGHELSHMADNNGLYWDKDGSFHPRGLLSPVGMEEFYKRTECVVREYGPAPMGCEAANEHYGNSTLGEDLADLTGIELSWLAYAKKHPNAQLDDKQHFFMVLAQAFCEKYDQKHLCEAVANDVHAIAMFRINRTFRNLKEFQRAFSCHTGQGMWKEDVCRVYGA